MPNAGDTRGSHAKAVLSGVESSAGLNAEFDRPLEFCWRLPSAEPSSSSNHHLTIDCWGRGHWLLLCCCCCAACAVVCNEELPHEAFTLQLLRHTRCGIRKVTASSVSSDGGRCTEDTARGEQRYHGGLNVTESLSIR